MDKDAEVRRLQALVETLKEEVERYRLKNAELQAANEFLKNRIDQVISIRYQGTVK